LLTIESDVRIYSQFLNHFLLESLEVMGDLIHVTESVTRDVGVVVEHLNKIVVVFLLMLLHEFVELK
jgi:hypothetical protein